MGYRFLEEKGEVELDMEKSNDAPLNIRVGGEYSLYNFFTLRAGYKYITEDTKLGNLYGLSGGFGINYKKYTLDYAYTPYGNIGNTAHRYSFQVKF